MAYEQYREPEVSGDDYEGAASELRQGFAIALAALSGEFVPEGDKDLARKSLRVFLAQKGSEHLEGCAGLAETCDIFIFG